MELFQPNNLSRSKPEFAPSKDSVLREEVEALLRNCYGFSELEDLIVAHFVGANVSSQNLKVTANSKSWFLKSRPKDSCKQLVAEVELTQSLARLGQRVPTVISSTMKTESKCWVLYEFQDGDYFSGTANELNSAAHTFAQLALAATQLDFPAVSHDEFRFFDELPQLLQADSLIHLVDQSLAKVCTAHRQKILSMLEQTQAYRSLIDQTHVPLHLDFHPSNLLMKDASVVCILDLEHLKRYPVLAGLGFAAYKLIRQAMVNDEFRLEELRSPSAVNFWIDAWQENFPNHRFTAAELGVGARFRILKLIHMILEATLERADHRSNFDLPKQIYSLYEADTIFG